MRADVAVLGAGIVGVSVAIHLARRGRSVVLIDRGPAGGETSFGNGGLIQREGVAPYAFPQSVRTLWHYAGNRTLAMRFGWGALPGLAPRLARYWWHSRQPAYGRIVQDYARLIAHSVSEHAPLVAEAGATALIGKAGWIEAYRDPRTLAAAVAQAQALAPFGLEHRALDRPGLAAAEPAVRPRFAGGVHWTQPWTVRDPFALTQAYLALFERLGGRFDLGDAMTLSPERGGWQVMTAGGLLTVAEAVVALGPWSGDLMTRLGRRLPLFVKRGYHAQYRAPHGPRLSMPVYDDAGYLMVPVTSGLRLTTGAEFVPRDARPNPAQLDAAEPVARDTFGLGDRLPGPAWLGSRPCTPDMKPIIGPAHRSGLWIATGHAHHGLTLGPATGRLLAEMMTGEAPFVDPAPYRMDRFR